MGTLKKVRVDYKSALIFCYEMPVNIYNTIYALFYTASFLRGRLQVTVGRNCLKGRMNMKIYLNLRVKELVDGFYASKEICTLLNERVDIIIAEREKALIKRYPNKNDRVLTSLLRTLNTSGDEIIKDILNDAEYRKLLGIKIVRRNNCNYVVHRFSLVFKITEEKAAIFTRAELVR